MHSILKALIILCAVAYNISCIHYDKTQFHSVPRLKQSAKSHTTLNNTIRDLHLFPINSLRFRLSELKNIKAIVIFMRDKNCFLSEKYGHHIAYAEKSYSKKGVQFIYNYVGKANPTENAKKDLNRFGFKGPYLIDSRQTLSNALQAKTAAEMFILTPQRQVVYKGPISVKDIHISGLFSKRSLRISNVLDAILVGKKVATRESSASNCAILQPQIKKHVFYDDVAPIIKNKCANCHNTENDAPIDLSSYEKIAGHHAMIKYVIDADLMPPWGVDPNTGPWKNNLNLTPNEKALLMKWLSSGLKKRFNVKRLVKKRKKNFIKNPDYIFKVPKTVIPEDGFLPLQTFYANIPLTENRWLKKIQFITKPRVIHHLSFSFIPSQTLNLKNNSNIKHSLCLKSARLKNFSGCVRAGSFWVPGRQKYFDFMNSGIRLPKNSSLYVEIHYEPIGYKVIDDVTEIRFAFHKKPPKYSWSSLIISDRSIKIPPQVSNYKNEITYTAKADLLLAALNPHMHLRGLASSVFVIDTSGNSKNIFNSSYNFNFQTRYYLDSPIKIHKGSVIKCINWFDNSSGNPVNPNPKQTVLWGTKTENEMSGCFLSFIYPTSKPPLDLL